MKGIIYKPRLRRAHLDVEHSLGLVSKVNMNAIFFQSKRETHFQQNLLEREMEMEELEFMVDTRVLLVLV